MFNLKWNYEKLYQIFLHKLQCCFFAKKDEIHKVEHFLFTIWRKFIFFIDTINFLVISTLSIFVFLQSKIVNCFIVRFNCFPNSSWYWLQVTYIEISLSLNLRDSLNLLRFNWYNLNWRDPVSFARSDATNSLHL